MSINSALGSLGVLSGQQWLEKSIKDKHIKLLEYEKCKILEPLGEGGFGQVFRAEWRYNASLTRTFAIKSLKSLKQATADQQAYEEIIKELRLLRDTSLFPRILKFYGVIKEPNTHNYLLVLEYADGGSLRNYLKNHFKKMDGIHKLLIAQEIASGVMCLHDEGIIHRDLNSANILIHEHHVKIGDLGLSKVELKNDAEVSKTISVIMGHPPYIDPQCFKRNNYIRDRKSDIYSLGVVLWELSSGLQPLQNISSLAIQFYVANGGREKPIPGTPDSYVKLYMECWDELPEKRPDIVTVYDRLGNIEWNDNMLWISEQDQETNEFTESITIYGDSSFTSDSEISNSGYDSFSNITNISTYDSTSSISYSDQISVNVGEKMDQLSIVINKQDTLIANSDTEPDNQKEFEANNNLIAEVQKIFLESLDYGSTFDETFQKIINYLKNMKTTPERFSEILRREFERYPCLLGFWYESYSDDQTGTTPDRYKAYEWYNIAAERNDSYAQWLLSKIYQFGHGLGDNRINTNLEKAFYWARKSAEAGNSCGQLQLSNFLKASEKLYWLKKAADGGNVAALHLLGDYYRKDNIEEAKKYYKMALALDFDPSYAALKEIRARQDGPSSEDLEDEAFRRYQANGE
ncbi:hypothetical protein G9A89_010870 [Geosiphon pyriformis]|nr:hypothetical protein G9A89_010870 [Geosiphon pyriformis]